MNFTLDDLNQRSELMRWNSLTADEQFAESCSARNAMSPRQFLENVASRISSASSTTDDVYRDLDEFLKAQDDIISDYRNPVDPDGNL